jgi:hypothetical protein
VTDRDGDETETDVPVVPNPIDGVVSGEARPPDEHTRRVAAAKRRNRGAEDTRTMQKAWDQDEIRAPSVTAPPPATPDKPPERVFRSGRAPQHLFGPPRSPTQAEAPSPDPAMGRDGAVRAYGREGAGTPSPGSRPGEAAAPTRGEERDAGSDPGRSPRGAAERIAAAREAVEQALGEERTPNVGRGGARAAQRAGERAREEERSRAVQAGTRGDSALEDGRVLASAPVEIDGGAPRPEMQGLTSARAPVEAAHAVEEGRRAPEDPAERAAAPADPPSSDSSAPAGGDSGSEAGGAGKKEGGGGGGGESGSGSGGTSGTMSTREYADRSIRQRRRERDRRAEKTALRLVFGLFVALGVGGYFLINSELVSGPEEERDSTAGAENRADAPPPVKAPPKSKGTTSKFDETPDIPALRALMSEGLTIAAEGIPEVVAAEQSNPASLAAATETCRFAYGIWEFSPNKRFRFLTTCSAFEGQTLVGAYEVQGSVVRMSPLIDGAVEIVSEFEVEKPSKMHSAIKVTAGEQAFKLDVHQLVTTIRGGLQGEAFRDSFAPKNTLSLPGQHRQDGAAPKPSKDPLLDLIKQKH